MRPILLLVLSLVLLSSCVSKRKYLELQSSRDDLESRLSYLRSECDQQIAELNRELSATRDALRETESNLIVRETQLINARNQLASLERQMEYFRETNTNLLQRLSDLSVISQTGAESIQKSLEALNEQNKYIKDLTNSIQRKDSLTLTLVMNLKRSLQDIDDEDVTIEVKKGVVYISLSDKMLFRSGSTIISSRAHEVLGKIARIVRDHQELDILVEGHTDTVPIRTECIKDNWDLSVLRATAIVRVLQDEYGVRPERMTAGGRSKYIPKADNATAAGRSINRRTEIVLLPKLDQFFDLLHQPLP